MSLCKIVSEVAAAKSTLRAKMGNKELNSDNNSCAGSIYKRCSSSNPCCPSIYDCRKYSHQLPTSCVMTPFEPLYCFPTGIFRCTSGEVLGQGANKCGIYKNPEYFSFHHMTFYDMHLLLRCFRQPCADTKRKPI